MGQTEKNSVRAYVFRFALELGQWLDAVGMALRHQWCKERPSHLSDNQGSIRRSGPAKGMSESKSPRQRICVNLRTHPNAQPVAKINLDQPKVGRLGSTT
jgi:hypothetical protein